MYKNKCGYIDEKENNPIYGEVTCLLVGCDSCKYKTNTIYYEQNIPKAVSLWAKTKN